MWSTDGLETPESICVMILLGVVRGVSMGMCSVAAGVSMGLIAESEHDRSDLELKVTALAESYTRMLFFDASPS
jgi:hypothetical protein